MEFKHYKILYFIRLSVFMVILEFLDFKKTLIHYKRYVFITNYKVLENV